jgi:GAF domain-containing protein
VAVPLVYRAAAVGTMNVYFASDRIPSAEEMAYLKALGDQAALAGANLRLFAEGSGAAGAPSPRSRRFGDDLPRSPEGRAGPARRECPRVTGAASAGIILTDESGEEITEVGVANLPDGYIDTIRSLWSHGVQIAGFEAIRTGQVVVAHDLPRLSQGIKLLEPHREFTDGNWDTLVAVPLIYRGKSVGTLNVCFSKDSLPGDDDMAVLRALADQAALTAANLRLFTESERRRRRAETLAMVATALTGRGSVEETLDALTQVVVETSMGWRARSRWSMRHGATTPWREPMGCRIDSTR